MLNSELDEAHQKRIFALHSNYNTNLEQIKINNSIRTPYVLSDEQNLLLRRYYNRYVVSDEVRVSQHPVAATLNYVATMELYNEFRNRVFIDVGANTNMAFRNNVPHCCVLVNNQRDYVRYATQIVSVNSNPFENYITNNVCTHGAQNCRFQSDVMIAINSLHDVDFKQLYDMFIKHNASFMVSYMFLPDEILDEDLITPTIKTFYNIKIRKVRGIDMLDMFFPGDLSFGYSHNLENLKLWLKTSRIIGKKFDLIIEINKSYGPFRRLHILKVPKLNQVRIPRSLNLSNLYSDFIKVPNMRFVASNDFKIRFRDIPMIVVPKAPVIHLYKFITRGADASFNFERGASYFHGLTSKIVVGNTVVTSDIPINAEVYDDLLFSIIMIAACSRVRRTKTFGKFMKNMDNQFEFGESFYEGLDLQVFGFMEGEKEWNHDMEQHESTKFYKKRDIVKDETYVKRNWLSKNLHDTWDLVKKFIAHGRTARIKYNVNYSKNFMMFTFEPFQDIDLETTFDLNFCCGKSRITKYHDFNFQNSPNNVNNGNQNNNFIKRNAPEIIHKNYQFSTLTKPLKPKFSFFERIKHSVIALGAPRNDICQLTPQRSSKSLLKDQVRKDKKIRSLAAERENGGGEIKFFDSFKTALIRLNNDSLYQIPEESRFMKNYYPRKLSKTPSLVTLKRHSTIEDLTNIVVQQENNMQADEVDINLSDLFREMPESLIALEGVIEHPGFCKTKNQLDFCYNFKTLNTDVVNVSSQMTASVIEKPSLDTALVSYHCENFSVQPQIANKTLIPSNETFVAIQKQQPVVAKVSNVVKPILSNAVEILTSKNAMESNYSLDVAITGILSDIVLDVDRLNVFRKITARMHKFDYENKVFKLCKSGPNYSGFGAQGKLRFICNAFDIPTNLTTLDYGCAPGSLCLVFKNITGLHYQNGLPMIASTKKVKNVNGYYQKIFNFNKIDDIPDIGRFDLLISDAADEANSDFYDHFMRLLRYINKSGTFIFKTFINFLPSYMEKPLFQRFKTVTFSKPPDSKPLSNEIYVICKNFVDNHIAIDLIALHSIIKICHNTHFVFQNEDLKELSPVSGNIGFVDVEFNVSYEDAKKFKIEFLNSDTEYQNLHQQMLVKLDQVVGDKTIKLRVHNAIFGSGKSKYIIEHCTPNDIVIIPTKVLKNKYVRAGVKCAYTLHRVMLHSRDVNNVFVDEFYRFNKPYFYYLLSMFRIKGSIYCFGDFNQIGFIDRSNFNFTKNDLLPEVAMTNLITLRTPMDVVKVARKIGYDQAKTTSKQLCSITHLKCPINDLIVNCANFKKQVIVVKQATKSLYINAGLLVNTVDEIEGATLSNAVWIIDESDAILYSKDEYQRVGLTRHTNNLVIYGDCEHFKVVQLLIEGTNLENITTETSLAAFDQELYKTDELKLYQLDFKPIFRDQYCDAHHMLDLLSKIVKIGNGGSDYFASVQNNIIPAMQQGIAKININNNDLILKPMVGKALVDLNTARRYLSMDKLMTKKTHLGRYGLYSKLRSSVNVNGDAITLKQGLSKFLKYNFFSKECAIHFKPTLEELNDCLFDYMEALNKKHLTEKDLGVSIEIFKNGCGKMLNFFCKKQDKFDPTFLWAEREKLGQGVSAWPKMLNACFSVYSRVFSRKLKSFVKTNVVIATSLNDYEIGIAIAKQLDQCNFRFKGCANDFTEFDASAQNSVIESELLNLSLMGMDPFLLDLYKEHRLCWTSSCIQCSSVKGICKQHSGQPFTLDFNTSDNMEFIGVLFDFKDMVVASFKGDDSVLFARFIEVSKLGQLFLNAIGYKTKIQFSDNLEFIGNIITSVGFYPDLIRKVVKILNKVYEDEVSFEEMKLAVVDSLSTIKCLKQQVTGRTALALYYNEVIKNRGHDCFFTTNDIEEIETFMSNFYKLKFDDLISVEKEHLIAGF